MSSEVSQERLDRSEAVLSISENIVCFQDVYGLMWI